MAHINPRRCAVLAAALLAGPALAQTTNVTIYGIIDASLNRVEKVDAQGRTRTSMDDGIITGTRLGFRIREDLGRGWAARAVLEAGFEPGTGLSLQSTARADFGQVASTTRFFGRDMHVALDTPLASVALGRQYTVAHTLAARFQPLGNPNSAAHSLFSSHHVARQDNLMRVDAKFGGLAVSASHTFGEQADSNANSAWALGVAYGGRGWSVAAYRQELKNLAGTETRRVTGAGGQWSLGTLSLHGGVMSRDDAVSPQRNRAWTLGANWTPVESWQLTYAHYDDRQSGSAALEGRRQVDWVQASYRFSKRSDVYAVVGRNRVTGGYARPAFMGSLGTQNNLALGLRHRF